MQSQKTKMQLKARTCFS